MIFVSGVKIVLNCVFIVHNGGVCPIWLLRLDLDEFILYKFFKYFIIACPGPKNFKAITDKYKVYSDDF